MDPHATDTNATKTPPRVLEYEPVQRRRRSRLTGWDWSLMVAILWLLPLTPRGGSIITDAVMRTAMWVGVAVVGRMIVGVVMRDRNRWWILYLGLDLASPLYVHAIACYGLRHGW